MDLNIDLPRSDPDLQSAMAQLGWDQRSSRIVPIAGGYSGNDVYRIEHGSENVCAKLFVDAALAEREWTVLRLLKTQSLECVPTPLMRTNGPRTALVMSWCDGNPLGNVALDPRQVDALGKSLIAFGSVPVAGFQSAGNLPPATVNWTRSNWDSPETWEVLQSRFDYLVSPVRDFLSSKTVDGLTEPKVIWLGRGDPNLKNAIDDGDVVRFVDFEHTGYTDRAIEFADLAEHPQSVACSEQVWDQLCERLDIRGQEKARVLNARRLFSVVWLAMFLTDDLAKRINTPERADVQAERVRYLLG
jgi:aminoglycoside phosphotransferase (APT) family kinase protein